MLPLGCGQLIPRGTWPEFTSEARIQSPREPWGCLALGLTVGSSRVANSAERISGVLDVGCAPGGAGVTPLRLLRGAASPDPRAPTGPSRLAHLCDEHRISLREAHWGELGFCILSGEEDRAALSQCVHFNL